VRELNKRVIGVGVEGSTSELLPGACDEFLFYERLLGPGTAKSAVGRKKGGSKKTVTDTAEAARLVTKTLGGLQRSTDGSVLSSNIKRALLRKDPTFSEGDYGFRTWGELMRHLEKAGVIALSKGSAGGDPAVDFPSAGGGEEEAFGVLRDLVENLQKRNGAPPLSGLKTALRKKKPDFSEKNYGYGGFLQFVKAAAANGAIALDWDDDAEEYYLSVP
jgi:hypothetical protein